jgi:hypothetical protein
MRSFIKGIVFILLLLISATQTAAASKRVALVVGNGAYQNVPSLPNPPRDAADVAMALGRLGFAVTLLNDLILSDMKDAVINFGVTAIGADMAVIFYAGHGVEAAGENWLIPIDAKIVNRADAEKEAVSLRLVNAQVANARQLGLVILDACRNNPFTTTLSSEAPSGTPSKDSPKSGTRSISKGLVPTTPSAANVLVAFAAKDGTVADDGDGRNSPFSSSLLHNIETPGLEITSLFRKVRDDVIKSTGGSQQPYVYGSLSNELIYLVSPLTVDVPKVRHFDGIWTMHLLCYAMADGTKAYRKDPVATIRDGLLTAKLGPEGKPNEFKFTGAVNEFGDIQIQVTGFTDNPKYSLRAMPRGTPFEFWITGKIDDSRGTGLRVEGRKCSLALSKETNSLQTVRNSGISANSKRRHP